MDVNEKLKRCVEQIEHIEYVINRCSKWSKNMDVDNSMLYIIAIYHDIGYHIDYKSWNSFCSNYV